MQISKFVQVRSDGNVVPAGMTVAEMLALGWGPSKVIALGWTHDGRAITVEAPQGIHGIVVPGSNYVAAILNEDGPGTDGHLEIFSPDGSAHGRLQNRVEFEGRAIAGRFGWFEPAVIAGDDVFGAVFQAGDEGEFRCDVDARLAGLTAVRRIR